MKLQSVGSPTLAKRVIRKNGSQRRRRRREAAKVGDFERTATLFPNSRPTEKRAPVEMPVGNHLVHRAIRAPAD